MNFMVNMGLQQNSQQFIINASDWATCFAYCEGTGNQIWGIQRLPNAIINYNVTGTTECFIVSAINTSGAIENHYVWETDFTSLSSWIESQGFQSIESIQSSNKTYVVV